MSNKKYQRVKLENDAPSGSVNFCTISFLTPSKVKKTKHFTVRGFKIYGGYNTEQQAKDDVKKIKEANDKHDVYVCELGKIYSWDDSTKTDEIDYGDKKLNELELTRRENMEKISLMKEQFKNEKKTIYANDVSQKLKSCRERLQKKLLDKGLITKKEYDMLQETKDTVQNTRQIMEDMEKMKDEIDECYKTDYLDETKTTTGLKCGCMTIFSPKNVGGIQSYCLKIRGLFDCVEDLQKRVRELQRKYPHDRIYTFEVGLWTVYTDDVTLDQVTMLKQLNFCMKCYLDHLEIEAEEFEKRKESLKKTTETDARKVKNASKKQSATKELTTKQQISASNSVPSTVTNVGNASDKQAIQKILNYLDDPELRGKYTVDSSAMETVEVNLNK